MRVRLPANSKAFSVLTYNGRKISDAVANVTVPQLHLRVPKISGCSQVPLHILGILSEYDGGSFKRCQL